ncbi:mRNA-decapping enzyme 1B isoform X2 [Cloeon dipterum]|uniref:mRNA-decapping enzyme 1B isoform X2 n=1 Tax=Cloeon dipterum TaxID=197152 RepID=UPI0032202167
MTTTTAMDSAHRMNTAALKKVDQHMVQILDTAAHVALYSFNNDENKWEKTEIEGALFLYSRDTQPSHAFIIMNRLNTNNLVEIVKPSLDFQIKEPFLLYKTGQASIFGIWFYNKNDCHRFSQNLDKLVKSLSKSPPQKRGDGVGGVDIFGMLSKAQEDFNSKKKTSSDAPQSVMEFFAKAAPKEAFPPQPVQPVDAIKPLLMRIMSNPANTLEHIEKQQRSTTPSDLPKQQQQQQQQQHQPPPPQPQQPAPVTPQQMVAAPPPPAPQPLPLVGMPSPVTPSAAVLFGTPPSVSSLPTLADIEANRVKVDQPALLPPNMFTNRSQEPVRWQMGDDISPLESTPKAEPVVVVKPEPLTRNQLLQAVSYLIKHDPEFVTKLHEAYVKSFNEML